MRRCNWTEVVMGLIHFSSTRPQQQRIQKAAVTSRSRPSARRRKRRMRPPREPLTRRADFERAVDLERALAVEGISLQGSAKANGGDYVWEKACGLRKSPEQSPRLRSGFCSGRLDQAGSS